MVLPHKNGAVATERVVPKPISSKRTALISHIRCSSVQQERAPASRFQTTVSVQKKILQRREGAPTVADVKNSPVYKTNESLQSNQAELPDEVPITSRTFVHSRDKGDGVYAIAIDTLLAAPADTAEPAKPALATARSRKAG